MYLADWKFSLEFDEVPSLEVTSSEASTFSAGSFFAAGGRCFFPGFDFFTFEGCCGGSAWLRLLD